MGNDPTGRQGYRPYDPDPQQSPGGAPPGGPAPQYGSQPHPGDQGQAGPPQLSPGSYGQQPYYEPSGAHSAQSQQQVGGATSRRYLLPVGIAVLVLFAMAAAFSLGGEPGKFATIGVQFAPLALLATLAYAGVRSSAAAFFAYVALGLLALGILFNAFASVLIVVVNEEFYRSLTQGRTGPLTLDQLFKPGAGAALGWAMVLLFLATVVSLLMLLRPVRVAVARIIPIDPDNFVHKIALSLLTLIFLTSFVPLIALGAPPILELVQSGATAELGEEAGLSIRPIDLIYQFIWTIPTTLVAAGWPIARGFRETLARLAMVPPTVMQVVAGVGIGLAMAAFYMFALGPTLNWLWTSMGWATTDEAAFEQLLSGLQNPLGAVLIGVTAGIGEEMAVRGLLQTRIGLIPSNLVFTSFHAFQYGPDALLVVFLIGIVLGIVRARTNTSTSAIVHAVYNFTLVIVGVLAGQQGG